MSYSTIFALGFVIGGVNVWLAAFAMVARYKFENMRARSLLEAAKLRMLQANRQYAVVSKRLVDTNAERERLGEEVAKLRDEKLDAWDVPGGF